MTAVPSDSGSRGLDISQIIAFRRLIKRQLTDAQADRLELAQELNDVGHVGLVVDAWAGMLDRLPHDGEPNSVESPADEPGNVHAPSSVRVIIFLRLLQLFSLNGLAARAAARARQDERRVNERDGLGLLGLGWPAKVMAGVMRRLIWRNLGRQVDASENDGPTAAVAK